MRSATESNMCGKTCAKSAVSRERQPCDTLEDRAFPTTGGLDSNQYFVVLKITLTGLPPREAINVFSHLSERSQKRDRYTWGRATVSPILSSTNLSMTSRSFGSPSPWLEGWSSMSRFPRNNELNTLRDDLHNFGLQSGNREKAQLTTVGGDRDGYGQANRM